ncbi:hypothetical protein F4553_006229 [Allocatelliglobosispora scoriae]|uniref:Uncharacterized protein n=1 Tax=Allocatelliglobosispora scoriae TaxID=643052 RepID=A0A841BYP9_9ACTN|nr:DUF6297 family protein [Allocatelliglobosispora scoriae]MBB5872795.1 hypothetical protein [Allocatelliglobosispora scoriae]
MSATSAARALIRSHQAHRSWSDRYLALFGSGIVIALVAVPVLAVINRLERVGPQADPTLIVIAVALVVLGFAALLSLARLVGPVVVRPADAAWLVPSPLPRRAVLAPSVSLVLLIAALVGSALGIVGLAALGAPDAVAARAGMAAGIGAAVAVALVCIALLAQPRDSPWLRVIAACATVAALGVAAIAAGRPAIGRPDAVVDLPLISPDAVLVVLGGTVVIAFALVLTSWRALTTFPARCVVDAAGRWGSATDAMLGLEPAFVARAAEDRYWSGRRLRSRRWPRLPPALAIAWADWRMLGRRPGRLAVLLPSAALPALLAMVLGRHIAVLLLLGAGTLAVAACGTAGLRRDTGDTGLRRMIGHSGWRVGSARLLLPGLLGGAWLAVALALADGAGGLPDRPWWAFGPVAAPVIAVAAVRMAQRGMIDHASTPIVMPMTGSFIPAGWLVWMLSGLDVAVLGCLPLLLALAGAPAGLGPYLVAQALLSALVTAASLRWST